MLTAAEKAELPTALYDFFAFGPDHKAGIVPIALLEFGFKPSVGLVSRTHIVPISHSQDTAGPMTTTVEDAAIVLTAIAGSDPLDPATAEADARKVDYRAALDAGSLNGARIGVMRFLLPTYSEEARAVFEQNLEALRRAGGEIVEPHQPVLEGQLRGQREGKEGPPLEADGPRLS